MVDKDWMQVLARLYLDSNLCESSALTLFSGVLTAEDHGVMILGSEGAQTFDLSFDWRPKATRSVWQCIKCHSDKSRQRNKGDGF